MKEKIISKIFNYIHKIRNNEDAKDIPREDVARILQIYDDLDFS